MPAPQMIQWNNIQAPDGKTANESAFKAIASYSSIGDSLTKAWENIDKITEKAEERQNKRYDEQAAILDNQAIAENTDADGNIDVKGLFASRQNLLQGMDARSVAAMQSRWKNMDAAKNVADIRHTNAQSGLLNKQADYTGEQAKAANLLNAETQRGIDIRNTSLDIVSKFKTDANGKFSLETISSVAGDSTLKPEIRDKVLAYMNDANKGVNTIYDDTYTRDIVTPTYNDAYNKSGGNKNKFRFYIEQKKNELKEKDPIAYERSKHLWSKDSDYDKIFSSLEQSKSVANYNNAKAAEAFAKVDEEGVINDDGVYFPKKNMKVRGTDSNGNNLYSLYIDSPETFKRMLPGLKTLYARSPQARAVFDQTLAQVKEKAKQEGRTLGEAEARAEADYLTTTMSYGSGFTTFLKQKYDYDITALDNEFIQFANKERQAALDSLNSQIKELSSGWPQKDAKVIADAEVEGVEFYNDVVKIAKRYYGDAEVHPGLVKYLVQKIQSNASKDDNAGWFHTSKLRANVRSAAAGQNNAFMDVLLSPAEAKLFGYNKTSGIYYESKGQTAPQVPATGDTGGVGNNNNKQKEQDGTTPDTSTYIIPDRYSRTEADTLKELGLMKTPEGAYLRKTTDNDGNLVYETVSPEEFKQMEQRRVEEVKDRQSRLIGKNAIEMFDGLRKLSLNERRDMTLEDYDSYFTTLNDYAIQAKEQGVDIIDKISRNFHQYGELQIKSPSEKTRVRKAFNQALKGEYKSIFTDNKSSSTTLVNDMKNAVNAVNQPQATTPQQSANAPVTSTPTASVTDVPTAEAQSPAQTSAVTPISFNSSDSSTYSYTPTSGGLESSQLIDSSKYERDLLEARIRDLNEKQKAGESIDKSDRYTIEYHADLLKYESGALSADALAKKLLKGIDKSLIEIGEVYTQATTLLEDSNLSETTKKQLKNVCTKYETAKKKELREAYYQEREEIQKLRRRLEIIKMEDAGHTDTHQDRTKKNKIKA